MFKLSATLILTVVLSCVICLTPVFADDVEDSIKEALQNYKAGDHSKAMENLNYASQLIAQKKGGDLKSFLPNPLEGWKADEAKTQAMGVHAFGGGVTAERQYHKDPSYVTVRIVTDSPMIQGIMMMINNPMMAGADGGKLEKINGEKAVVKYDANSKGGNINLVIGNRFMITVEGSDVSSDDLKKYASGIDFKKLAALP